MAPLPWPLCPNQAAATLAPSKHQPAEGITISRLWQIVSVLQRAGVTVYAIQTRDPGRIVYEDDCQVAAIPRGDWLQHAARELSEHTPDDLLSALTPARPTHSLNATAATRRPLHS